MTAVNVIGGVDQLERVAAAAAHAVPHRLPLFRAACDGRIALIEPQRGSIIAGRVLKSIRRPAILLIGDDDETPSGPNGWACARRARRWASAAIVHAAGGDAAHYRAAVEAAERHQRVLLVETTSRYQETWASFLPPALPVAIITTRDGDRHPRAECHPLQ